MNIGIFDSGIGGMSILHQAIVTLPNEKYIFYADTDHVPYGTKSKQEVIGFVDGVMQFMLAHECKAVVIACNTATAVAAAIMREKYDIPIIGIEPAVKLAVKESDGKRILVVATPLTVKENKLKELVERVDDDHLVDLHPLPQLVSFAERGEFVSDAVSEYLTKELSKFNLDEYSELVLGCTHFNYFKDTFKRLLPKDVNIVDGNTGTVNQLKRVLEGRGELAIHKESVVPQVRYFESGREILEASKLENIERLHNRLEIMRKI